MPELKFVRQPAREIAVLDEYGRTVDLAVLEGRRLKWARRRGRKIHAMIAGLDEGARGIMLQFRSGADYEDCIRRVLKPEKSF